MVELQEHVCNFLPLPQHQHEFEAELCVLTDGIDNLILGPELNMMLLPEPSVGNYNFNIKRFQTKISEIIREKANSTIKTRCVN